MWQKGDKACIRLRKKSFRNCSGKLRRPGNCICPVETCGQVNYAPWSEDAKVDLDTLKTVKSAKDAFFPQSENLYTCYRDGKKISITPQELKEQPFVVFGMKACDLRGVEVLDKVFLADPVDTFYAARREHGTIVAMACHEPEDSCFCKVFGIDCAEPKADVAVWTAGEVLYWKAQSEKGEALTYLVKDLLEEAADGGRKSGSRKGQNPQDRRSASVYAAFPGRLGRRCARGKVQFSTVGEAVPPMSGVRHLHLCVSRRASATISKTTIRVTGSRDTAAGIRCMYSDFTMMAHGNNRTSQMQRFRQRFMHKLVYFPANNDGMFSCTGCGRCVEKCPQSLNIVKVIKAFAAQGGKTNE